MSPQTGWHHSEETKAKMRKPKSEETKVRMRDAQLGSHHLVSLDTRKKMSNSRKGKPNGRSGLQHSEETKQKISKAHLGMKRSEESVMKSATTPHLHHRDFDHDNNLPENRKLLSRRNHILIHSRSGRRGIIFVKSSMENGIVTKDFYERYLSYINQEEEYPSDDVSSIKNIETKIK
jgi:hypothetical protein